MRQVAKVQARRYLTAKRRKAISWMRLEYSLWEPLDPRNADEMARQEDWYVRLVASPTATVGYAAVHRVPLANGDWLDNETDAGNEVPGSPVAAVTDGFDWLSKKVLGHIGNPERSADASFLVVESMQLDEDWRGLTLEALVLARILVRLSTPDALFAVAEPVITHPPRWTRRVDPYQETVFEALGFAPLKKGLWITDLSDIHHRHDALNERFGTSDSQSRWESSQLP